ncbi:MAG: CRISPR-associated protein Csx11 [Fidelibacterota bacterium]
MTDIQNLSKPRKEDLLKAEIATLLFNLGKTHAGISNWKDYYKDVNPKFSSYKDYFNNNYFIDEMNEVDSTGQLKNIFENNSIAAPDKNGNIESVSLISCMQAGESNNNFVKKVMFRGCENINSGIDKGALPESQKIKGKLYISNAFGTHKEDVDPKCFDNERMEFFQRLHQEMEDKKWYDNPDWSAIRNFIFGEIKSWYSHLLSDSRFPANDVTLWDQVYMTASMFKAVLAGIYLKLNQENYVNNPQKIQWQILGIQYDKLALAEKGAKPAFINWYREKTNTLDNDIKKYFETDLAIANEIYRDETGIYFLFPNNTGVAFEHKKHLQVLKNCFKDIEKEIIGLFTKQFPDEIFPAIFLTKPCRGLMNLTQLLSGAKDNFLYAPFFLHRTETGKNKSNQQTSAQKEKSPAYPQICQVCRVRLEYTDKTTEGTPARLTRSGWENTEKDDIRLCKECRKRKKGRLEKWIEKQNNETIWLDELQDKNSRIALITLRFELKEWLNGNMLSALLNQQLQNGKRYDDLLNCFIDELKTCRTKKIDDSSISTYIGDLKRKGITIEKLIKNWLLERSIGDGWEKLLSTLNIDFNNMKLDFAKYSDVDYKKVAGTILQFLLRKNPSPPRIRRIWDSTLKFTTDLQKKINEKQKAKRLVFDVEDWKDDWEGKEENVGGLLYFFHERKAYLLTSLQKAWGQIRKRSSTKFSDFQKDGFNNWENRIQRITEINTDTLGKIKVSNQHLEDFLQIFSIMDPTPVSWQFAIPAESVPEIIKTVQKSYKEEFKYVHGKLPLHIGMVVQNYKAPLYVGLKALRNIRRELSDWEKIKKSLKATEFPEKYEYGKTDHERINNPPDYYALFQHEGDCEYSFYFPPEKEPVSISKLEAGKSYRYYPNTIDFEYLDCNTRRNDIVYNKGKRTIHWCKKRPYDWRDWERFETFHQVFGDSESSQLHNLITRLYSLLEDWRGESVFIQKLAGSAIINTLKPKNMKSDDQNRLSKIFGVEKWQEIRKEVTVDLLYEFIDMYDFYHKTLKEV